MLAKTGQDQYTKLSLQSHILFCEVFFVREPAERGLGVLVLCLICRIVESAISPEKIDEST